MIVNTWGVPVQVTAPNVYSGVTVMVATTGATPALVAAKAAMLPVPLAASPIEGVSLVQLYAVPVPEKFTTAVFDPLHTTWSTGSVTVGVGFTVMVNTCGVPTHTGPAV